MFKNKSEAQWFDDDISGMLPGEATLVGVRRRGPPSYLIWVAIGSLSFFLLLAAIVPSPKKNDAPEAAQPGPATRAPIVLSTAPEQ